MDRITHIISLIGLMIIPLLLCFCNEDEEKPELKAMVMDLVFLSTYEQHVRTHGTHIIDKSQKIHFFSTWEPILGAEKANAVFEGSQKHLKYALDISNITDSDHLSALVVAIHARIMAFNRGVNYLACIIFAQFYPSVTFKLEHCQNIAIHLFIFTKLGLEELMKKYLSIIKPRMNYLVLLCYMNNIMEDLLKIPNTVNLFLKTNLLEEQVDSAQLRSIADDGHFDLFYMGAMDEIRKLISHTDDLEFLLLDMNPGVDELCNLCERYRLYNSIDYKDDINFWTNTSFQINEKLEQTCSSDLDQRKYDVISLLRENIVHSAEVDGVNRREIAEIFESLKLDPLKIYLKVRTLIPNVPLWNSK